MNKYIKKMKTKVLVHFKLNFNIHAYRLCAGWPKIIITFISCHTISDLTRPRRGLSSGWWWWWWWWWW